MELNTHYWLRYHTFLWLFLSPQRRVVSGSLFSWASANFSLDQDLPFWISSLVIYIRPSLVVKLVLEWLLLGSHHSSYSRVAWWRVTWHLFSAITSFHRFDFLIGHWWMFPFPYLLTSYVIMFILVLKQPSFGTLILLDSRRIPMVYGLA